MGLIYHYTTIEALYGMLTNKNNEIVLRATNILCLNDPEEYYYGQQKVIKNIKTVEDKMKLNNDERISKIFDEKDFPISINDRFSMYSQDISFLPYIISFSKESDSLPMWNMYGQNGNGISLGFERNEIFDTFRASKIDDVKYNPNDRDVVTEIEKIYSQIIETRQNRQYDIFYLNREFEILCNHIAIIFKNEAYFYEREVRMIMIKKIMKDLKFKISNGFIIPYYEIEINKIALKEIIFGPTHNFNRSIYSVKTFLQTKKIDLAFVKFKQSKIQYRI